jgi:hypothetical protein
MRVTNRRRHRSDLSQSPIVAALRRAHVKVFPIGRPCDLLCLRGDRYYLLDCGRTKSSRERDADQLRAFEEWRVTVVDNEIEALKAVGL